MVSPKSIRWRLQLWLAFLLICVLSGFGITAYQLHRITLFAQIDDELELRLGALKEGLNRPPPFDDRRGPPPFAEERRRFPQRRGRPGFPRRPPPPDLPLELRDIQLSPPVLNLFNESDIHAFYFAIWTRGEDLLKRSTNAPVSLNLPQRLAAGNEIRTRTRQEYREVIHFTELGDCFVVGRNMTVELGEMRRFTGWLFAAGAAVLALGLGGGWSIATRALRPVEDISTAANRIAAGNLSERISISETDDELGRLAGVLNSTFSRLDTAFAQQRQFTADASHELRTPLAVLISETQTTLARERSAAEYRETVEACLEIAQQMRQLSESLLEIARFDAGQEILEQEHVDLAKETGHCVERVKSLAAQRGIEIECDLAPSECTGDSVRIRQVITNFVVNAIHYNRDSGKVRVTTTSGENAGCFSVSDTGPGIDAEDLPHIFERFYRADRSRGRASGRSGLGLSICRSIVSAHGGHIEVTSEPGSGTTFTVQLPFAPK